MTVHLVVPPLQLPSQQYHKRRSSPSKYLRQLRDLDTRVSACLKAILHRQRTASATLRLTVDARLERLPTHFTRELAGACLLIHLDRDGFLMVAEQARKGGRQWFFLENM